MHVRPSRVTSRAPPSLARARRAKLPRESTPQRHARGGLSEARGALMGGQFIAAKPLLRAHSARLGKPAALLVDPGTEHANVQARGLDADRSALAATERLGTDGQCGGDAKR